MKQLGDAGEIFVENGRQVVARHVVDNLDLEVEGLKPALQSVLVLNIFCDLLVGSLGKWTHQYRRTRTSQGHEGHVRQVIG